MQLVSTAPCVHCPSAFPCTPRRACVHLL